MVYGLTKKTNSDGTFVKYAYYADGSLKSVETSFSKTEYGYDILGRLDKVIDNTGGITTYGYDKNGNIEWSLNPVGTKTTYAYDCCNRLIDEVVTSATGVELRKYHYELDEVGRREVITENGIDMNTKVITYGYDSLGRLESEKTTVNGDTTEVSYTFDKVSNRITKNENGNVTKYQYDGNNRLTK